RGRTYDIGNRVDWLKTSLEFAMNDDEIRPELIEYLKNLIDGYR
ncbi:MAG: UTP--glucose-phosphate uridylyltransferase, partial [Methanothermobacter sp.]|nr:UTP--glucose-phosphate uridylyltransferase [Methanothermobacter sp.]